MFEISLRNKLTKNDSEVELGRIHCENDRQSLEQKQRHDQWIDFLVSISFTN